VMVAELPALFGKLSRTYWPQTVRSIDLGIGNDMWGYRKLTFPSPGRETPDP
jgi:hypothetical protein